MKKLRDFAAMFAGDIAIAAVAVAVLAASYAASPEEAYLFPRLSAALLALFCAANLAAHCRVRRTPPISPSLLRKLAPGLSAIVVYVALAEAAGFYPASAAAFFALSWLYAGERHRWRRLRSAALATLAMMAAVYLLFGALLQAQTPPPFWSQ